MKSLNHYEVLGLLGRGGMGEVHRARDTKLGREVALKLLPQDLANEPERMARFRREAKVLASLHHPNIASIFGLEEDQGRTFLVMELAEGDDLSVRIGKGAMPEEEVLDIARQMAAALEEAHEQGIVHRDLKPANIKVSAEGKVKILDFGLARAYAGETAAEENLDASPTITAAMTGQGVLLGTAAYMSPEQARGRPLDRRADIWSFGVVLFEMATGKRLFDGETISDTLAAVLRADPDWDALPEDLSPGLRRLIERCLERDPRRRLRDIGEARVFLEGGGADSSLLSSAPSVISGVAPAEEPRSAVARWLPWGAAVLLFALGIVVGPMLFAPDRTPRLIHAMIPPTAGDAFNLLSTRPGPAALSPDGRMLAFSARDEGGAVRLYVRRLDSAEAVALSGTDDATYPFWSPDNRFIGFFTENKLKKVAVGGGPPVTLCAATNGKGGTWNEDGVILFAPTHAAAIHRVAATGGEPVAVTTIDPEGGENSHRHPRFLPDGEHFLFLARLEEPGEGGLHRVYLGSLDGSEPRAITESQAAAEYSAGHLLTVREGILLATPFDAGSLALGDNGVPLVENVLVLPAGAACTVATPTVDGMLAYQVSSGTLDRFLEWVDLEGQPQGRVGDAGEFFRPRVSPDGRRAFAEIMDRTTGNIDLWLVDLETGLRTRFTFDEGEERNACWTPDGREVVYTTSTDGEYRVVRRPVEGTGGGGVLFTSERQLETTQVSPDGKRVVIDVNHPETEGDIQALPLEGGEPMTLLATGAIEGGGKISPNGRWLAFHESTETSTWQIYVVPLSGGDRRWQVTTEGAVYPEWSRDGRRLFYVDFAGNLFAVDVDGEGETFRVGASREMLRIASPRPGGSHFSMHPDETRLLHCGNQLSDEEAGLIHLVTDWPAMLGN